MIDLHTHLLPSIDDGARLLQMSLTMARQAVDAGTAVMVCTPHIDPGLCMNDSADIAATSPASRPSWMPRALP